MLWPTFSSAGFEMARDVSSQGASVLGMVPQQHPLVPQKCPIAAAGRSAS